MAGVEIEGMDELRKRLAEMGEQSKRIEHAALKKAAGRIEAAIIEEVPVRSGNLKKSIKSSGVRTKDGIKHVLVGPSKDCYYGVFVEFGTVHQKADPFMARGFEKSKEEALEIVANELRAALGL